MSFTKVLIGFVPWIVFSLVATRLGPNAVGIRCDSSKLEDLDRLYDAVRQRASRIDIVVANAGIGNGGATLDKTSEHDWKDMIDVNLTGVFHTAKVAIPSMIEAGRGGSILFTSSIGGLKGIQNVAHYVACKHGIVGLMRTLANELGPYSIRVNTIHPTNVDTIMIQNPGTWAMFSPGDPEPSQEKAMPGFLSLNTLPVPWIEPVDISNAVLFLASDEARYVTGVTFPVDAGAFVK